MVLLKVIVKLIMVTVERLTEKIGNLHVGCSLSIFGFGKAKGLFRGDKELVLIPPAWFKFHF